MDACQYTLSILSLVYGVFVCMYVPKEECSVSRVTAVMEDLKGYCTIFQHALKSLEITGIVLSSRMLKTGRKNSRGLKSYKEFKF